MLRQNRPPRNDPPTPGTLFLLLLARQIDPTLGSGSGRFDVTFGRARPVS